MVRRAPEDEDEEGEEAQREGDERDTGLVSIPCRCRRVCLLCAAAPRVEEEKEVEEAARAVVGEMEACASARSGSDSEEEKAIAVAGG